MPKSQAKNNDKLLLWLSNSGITFNPFEAVEASSDVNLSRYLVEHNEFVNIWGNWPNLIFAPAGGGKTAMRIRLTQACFTGGDINRPFPINYVLPYLKWKDRTATYEDHLNEVIHTAGQYLLLFLACRPYRFFQLKEMEQKQVAKVISWALPTPILTLIEPCIQSGNLNYLLNRFSRSITPPPREEKESRQFLLFLKTNGTFEPNPSLIEKWESLIEIVTTVLGFPSIYLLIDGVDAAPTTINNPQKSLEYIMPLLKRAKSWISSNIFVKFFLPEELNPYLNNDYDDLLERINVINILWTHSNLADVIRKRIYVASEGIFGGLQPLCSPAISEIEMQIARSVVPLPREMIVFTRQLILNHVDSTFNGQLLTPEVFENTVRWYQKNKP